ncbi:MAG: tRNA 4-thiouridine(8) synthase ThiI [Succinivibrionaceae bacterium]|nr:tRNA 4-thiouridine(8) synthase ThiI [Succinivibrionaceae bacterium]
MKLIIRLAPEISVKSRPVRSRLISLLRQNIRNVLSRHGLEASVSAQWDKIEVSSAGNGTDLIGELGRIPGIHSFLEADEFPWGSLDDLYQGMAERFGHRLAGKTFAFRVKRRGVNSFTSLEAERELGGRLQENFPNAGVNLSHPDITVRVEVEPGRAFAIMETHLGLGGFPVGSQGEILCLISGGFDSAVAAFHALRRGCRVNFVFFSMGGVAHEIGVMEECHYLWERYASSHRVRFVTVPFEEAMGQILERVHHGVRGVVLKRLLVRVASMIGLRLRCEALVTGESLGQVSSQTLRNLSHIDSASELMVMRPLICLDKQQIVDEAVRLGTASFSERMPEYCGVVSDHPNVCPGRDFVETEEAKLDPDLVGRAVHAARALDIRETPAFVEGLKAEVETVSALHPGEVVIDVRVPDEESRDPLADPGHEILKIPFYRLGREFGKLRRDRVYALYCAQGVMSETMAMQLKGEGHHNIKVYRPAQD